MIVEVGCYVFLFPSMMQDIIMHAGGLWWCAGHQRRKGHSVIVCTTLTVVDRVAGIFLGDPRPAFLRAGYFWGQSEKWLAVVVHSNGNQN